MKYQISQPKADRPLAENIKDQIYIYACPVNSVRNFFGVFFLFNILYLIFLVSSVSASPIYPIAELGSCRDQKECKLYCDIPANTPACWSYGKYVIGEQVLGETDVNISYPIAELGNCAGADECFRYCAHPKNQKACFSYAKKSGLVQEEEEDDDMDETKKQELIAYAKEELGCDGKDACMELCSDPTNADKCMAFGKKHGLDQNGPGQRVMEKAKTELGCDSETSCKSFCEKEENQEKCIDFAKNNGLMKPKEAEKIKKMKEKSQELIKFSKEELGCNSKDSCYQVCQKPENQEKCQTLGRKAAVNMEEAKSQGKQIPCTNEKECKSYCQIHPDECPGASGRPNTKASDTALERPKTGNEQTGEFIGPSGCKTEEECKNYCQKYPDKCPGFPKKEEVKITPDLRNTEYKPQSHPTRFEARENQTYQTPNPNVLAPPQ